MTTTPTLIAEAIHELQAYAGAEHRAALDLVHAILDQVDVDAPLL